MQEHVRVMLKETPEKLTSLELIDDLERLGLGYLFEEEIKQSLVGIYGNIGNDMWMKDNLYATALHFRVLRQHGYQVSQGNKGVGPVIVSHSNIVKICFGVGTSVPVFSRLGWDSSKSSTIPPLKFIYCILKMTIYQLK
ncbi:hypothetical protein GIB67_043097 [Kingdonia uniflora]|uniref:Terpene synthase N-terminal domain-containing protein n=1 Tax=Kingdonia uniflora TaxID=39325 RepID=A0A7J7NVB4_9MAGN|nr:hypothetical protein GIB67_043097 [Kingdonia uniflora]